MAVNSPHPRLQVVFHAAQRAATAYQAAQRSRESGQALHQWLCAEVTYQQFAGIDMVQMPTHQPTEPWQVELWQGLATVLARQRETHFQEVFRPVKTVI